jgi:hypothetical protein
MKLTRLHVILLFIASSLIVGALSIAPVFLAQQALGSDYQGIPFLFTDNEDFYIARCREVMDGYPNVGSPYFYEYKDEVAVQPALGEPVHAMIAEKTGISLITVFVWAKFFLPALLFLLIGLFTYQLTQGESWMRLVVGITAGLGATIGYEGFGIGNGLHLSLWTRPINPIVGGLGLFFVLLLAWRMFARKETGLLILAGIMTGLLTCYFFSWALAMAMCGLLMLAALIRKEWRVAMGFALVLGISLLMNINRLIGFSGAESQALAMRNGLLLMRTPLLNKVLLAAGGVFAVCTAVIVYRAKEWRTLLKQPWWIFCAALLAAGLAVLNQQVLTGKAIWPYHFVQYTKPFALIVVLVSILHAVPDRWKRVWIGMCAVLSFAYVGHGVWAASTHVAVQEEFRSRQEQAALIDRINKVVDDGVVLVLGPEADKIGGWIPAYTSANVYWSNYVMSGVPMERIEHNLFLRMRIENVAPSSSATWLTEHREDVRALFFRDWFDVFSIRKDDPWLDGEVSRLASKYQEVAAIPLREYVDRYRLDLLVSPRELTLQERGVWGIDSRGESINRWYVYPISQMPSQPQR